jgi:hypothetical protein
MMMLPTIEQAAAVLKGKPSAEDVRGVLKGLTDWRDALTARDTPATHVVHDSPHAERDYVRQCEVAMLEIIIEQVSAKEA